MAKIVIIIGRSNSGKTRTINKIGDLLNLQKCISHNSKVKAGIPSFVTWTGEAKEIFLRTGSIQEDATSRYTKNRKVFAQTSSLQERNKAILKMIIEETNNWIEFLKKHPDSITILPFTLLGKDDMDTLIIEPLNVFKMSPNEIVTVYLEKKSATEKEIIERVISKVKPDYIIESVKNAEQKQATTILDILHLKRK